MISEEEKAYSQGSRMDWGARLRECLRHLGYDDPEARRAGWIIEREAAILALRDVCSTFGDNEWDEDLSLADVVEKHLARHLHERGHAND